MRKRTLWRFFLRFTLRLVVTMGILIDKKGNRVRSEVFFNYNAFGKQLDLDVLARHDYSSGNQNNRFTGFSTCTFRGFLCTNKISQLKVSKVIDIFLRLIFKELLIMSTTTLEFGRKLIVCGFSIEIFPDFFSAQCALL